MMLARLPKGKPLRDRLDYYSMPVPECGCFLWLGSVNRKGYGQIRIEGGTYQAHRAAWEEENGPIPDGMMICHTCDVPSCISLDHLFLGTAKDNNDDKIAKGRQKHPRGEDHGRAKLSVAAVKEIYMATGTHMQIAKQFGINKSAVDDIKGGRCWSFVTGTPAGDPGPSS